MEEKDEGFRERDDAREKKTRCIEKLIEEREEKKVAEAEGGEEGETVVECEAEKSTPEEKDLTLPEVETCPIDLLYEELAASECYEWVQAVLARKQHEETK
ncbi:hypothetical protein PI124_g12143 [Phytophthora idaei]|nr:hypothetical protein PI126_g9002 [Phytophthora idaei]KAG3243046.1 hypothetical protein PI124_g12143 [Phytophthora idaei]